MPRFSGLKLRVKAATLDLLEVRKSNDYPGISFITWDVFFPMIPCLGNLRDSYCDDKRPSGKT